MYFRALDSEVCVRVCVCVCAYVSAVVASERFSGTGLLSPLAASLESVSTTPLSTPLAAATDAQDSPWGGGVHEYGREGGAKVCHLFDPLPKFFQ